MAVNKFKVGDKVRCIHGSNVLEGVVAGTVYEVTGFNGQLVFLKEKRLGWYQYRFGLVEEEEKTPQELMDEYRRLRAEAREVAEVLKKRGYEIQWGTAHDPLWRSVLWREITLRAVKETKEIL